MESSRLFKGDNFIVAPCIIKDICLQISESYGSISMTPAAETFSCYGNTKYSLSSDILCYHNNIISYCSVRLNEQWEKGWMMILGVSDDGYNV